MIITHIQLPEIQLLFLISKVQQTLFSNSNYQKEKQEIIIDRPGATIKFAICVLSLIDL